MLISHARCGERSPACRSTWPKVPPVAAAIAPRAITPAPAPCAPLGEGCSVGAHCLGFPFRVAVAVATDDGVGPRADEGLLLGAVMGAGTGGDAGPMAIPGARTRAARLTRRTAAADVQADGPPGPTCLLAPLLLVLVRSGAAGGEARPHSRVSAWCGVGGGRRVHGPRRGVGRPGVVGSSGRRRLAPAGGREEDHRPESPHALLYPDQGRRCLDVPTPEPDRPPREPWRQPPRRHQQSRRRRHPTDRGARSVPAATLRPWRGCNLSARSIVKGA